METPRLGRQHPLNIAAMSASTKALGPGLRAVIWVQGCPINCKGCIAPNWIPFKQAELVYPHEILDRLDIDSLDGITFSGGEPMVQAEGLAILARMVRQKKEINIICFTGFRYEWLKNNPPNPGVPELLAELDVLIDGPYIQERNDSIGLRGSSNQRILHLTNRLQAFDLEKQYRSVELIVRDGEISFVGIPTPAIKAAVDMAHLAGVKG